MDLLQQIDGYCERLDASYWSEPVNAVTNGAFLVAAAIMWVRCRGLLTGQVLAAILFAIGIGSWLFHTHAQVWAAIADVTPIAAFILVYIFAINRDVLGLSWVWALVGTILFLPYAGLTIPLWQTVPVYGVSAGYMPVPALIILYGLYLWRSERRVAQGFFIGAGILLVSLLARSVDETLCAKVPLGTHFLWHILNAVMLGWMIEVYRRHEVHPR